MNCINKINWELFRIQKEGLVRLVESHKTTQEEVDVLDGVINLMDAIQDEFKPTGEDEGVDQEEVASESA